MTSKQVQQSKQKSRLAQKQKQERNQNQDQKQTQAQSQKQKLEQLTLYLALLTAAVAGRAAMQGFPSVEPITFFALLAGAIFGSRIGFVFGAKAMFLSNFLVLGSQGFWTPFQMLGMGIAGYLGGFLGRKGRELSYTKVLPLALFTTVLYEIIVNIGWALTFGFHLIFVSFLTALPFSITHISSNAIFVSLLPKAHKHADNFSFDNLLKLLPKRFKKR